MASVVSPTPVGRTGHGRHEQQRTPPPPNNGKPSARRAPAAQRALDAEETRLLRLGELSALGKAIHRLGSAAAALQIAEAATDDMPRAIDRLKATADLATHVDDEEERARINTGFVELRDKVLSSGRGATFRGAALFDDGGRPGQVPVGSMVAARSPLAELEVRDAARLPTVISAIDQAAEAAGRDRRALSQARGEVDAAARALAEEASHVHDVDTMEARARATARAIRAGPAEALMAARNPAAAALALMARAEA